MRNWKVYWFPDPKTEVAKNLILYHDLTLVVCVGILVLVAWFLFLFLFKKIFFGGIINRSVHRNNFLEIVWTVSPSFILFVLGYISLLNLYHMELGDKRDHVVKVTGHQWYWEYEYLLNQDQDITLDDVFIWFLEKYISVEEEPWINDIKEVTKVINKDEGLNNESCKDGGDDINKNILISDEEKEVKLFNRNDKVEFLEEKNNNETNNEKAIDELVEYKEFEGDLNLEDEVVILDHEKAMRSSKFYNATDTILNFSLWAIGKAFVVREESFIVPDNEIIAETKIPFASGFRNQDVRNPCYLARSVLNEVLVSTADVIHSWGLTELGVKVDAIPGRINSASIIPYSSGVCYGNCYELCGVGHRQIPIKVVILRLRYVEVILNIYKFDKFYNS